MERADLLYSGLMLTALILSLWTAALVTAACFLFGRVLLEHRAPSDDTILEHSDCSKLAARSS